MPIVDPVIPVIPPEGERSLSSVRDLIRGALRLLGVVAPGEQPTADEMQDALSALNDMVESWTLEKLMVYAMNPLVFALTTGKATYSLGSGEDWDAARPVKIDSATLRTASGDSPIDLITYEQWAAITNKSQQGIPEYAYINPTYPNMNVSIWPIPGEDATILLGAWAAVSTFDSLDTLVVLPKGYARALRYGLALELYPEYPNPQIPMDVIATTYQNAKSAIKRVNQAPTPLMQCDPALLQPQTPNIYSGR